LPYQEKIPLCHHRHDCYVFFEEKCMFFDSCLSFGLGYTQ